MTDLYLRCDNDNYASSEFICSDNSMEQVHEKLEVLEDKYGEFLKQESIKHEVSILKHSVGDYLNGSREAEEYLSEHAVEIIEDVKNKLDGAVIEQTRLQDELQTFDNFTGCKVDKASKAAAAAADAKSALETVFEQNQS